MNIHINNTSKDTLNTQKNVRIKNNNKFAKENKQVMK